LLQQAQKCIVFFFLSEGIDAVDFFPKPFDLLEKIKKFRIAALVLLPPHPLLSWEHSLRILSLTFQIGAYSDARQRCFA